MDRRANDRFSVTVHSINFGKRPENTGNDFICDLPQELFLSPHDNYQVALVRLICDRPLISGAATRGKDILLVELLDINPVHHDSYFVAFQHVDPQILGGNRWREFQQSQGSVILEPRHKLFFPLLNTQLTSLHIRLRDRYDKPFYRKRQITTAVTAVFEFRKMSIERVERMPFFLSSHPSAAFPDNTAQQFDVNVLPRFSSRTSNPWYIALTSITYNPQFSLFPSILHNEQRIILRRNLGDDVNALEEGLLTLQASAEEDERHYDVDEATGDITWKFRMSDIKEPDSKRELMYWIMKGLKLKKDSPVSFSIAINKKDDSEEDEPPRRRGGVKFEFRSAYDNAQVEMNYFLAVLLGLTPFDPKHGINDYVRIDCGYKFVRQNTFDNWFEPKKLFIYANFVEPSINGGEYTRLLDIIPVDTENKRDDIIYYRTYSPVQLSYKTLNMENLTECHIEMRDDFGNLVAFKYPNRAHTLMSLVIQTSK